MNEEDINPEEGLDKDIERNEKKLNEQYQEQTKGNELFRKRQEEARAKKKQRRNRQKQIEASQKQAEEIRKKNRQDAIDAARAKMGEKAPKVYNRQGQEVLDDGTTVVTDEDMRTEGPIVDVEDEGFLKSAMKKAGQVLTVYGQAMDKVDQNVLGRIGFGDYNLYAGRKALINGLSSRHVALGILGEFLLPDSVDLATAGLGYIPKRFLKTPKLLKKWAQMTKASTVAEKGSDIADFRALGGRPRLAQRIDATDLPDANETAALTKYYEQLQKAKNSPRPKRGRPKKPYPTRVRDEILSGKRDPDWLDLEAATTGPGLEATPGFVYDRAKTTTITKKMVRDLAKKYNVPDQVADSFLKRQKDFERQIKEAQSALNQHFQLQNATFAVEDMQEAYQAFNDAIRGAGRERALEVMQKIKPTINDNDILTFIQRMKQSGKRQFDIGHVRSAKNQARQGREGVNYVSNMRLESSLNEIDSAGNIIRPGNLARGSRSDLPDLVNLATGVSRDLEEEFLKFIDPTIGKFFDRVLPEEFHAGFKKAIKEAIEMEQQFGITNFDEYLEEIFDLTPKAFKKLGKEEKTVIRRGFNKQKSDKIHPQQQLDMFNSAYNFRGKQLKNRLAKYGNTPEARRSPGWVERLIDNYLTNLDVVLDADKKNVLYNAVFGAVKEQRK
tara:strand:- start:44 stop:2050 length:2007 start_codon:yes stop_codon:yes gene_type:complete